jgi:hypothetical protein
MEVQFNREEFRRTLREQLDYIIKHESSILLEDVINELIHQRLVELAEEELNEISNDDSYASPTSLSENLSKISLEINPMDINHRLLVREVLKRYLRASLESLIRQKLS